MLEVWRSVIVTLCLGYFSVEDIRKKEITGWPLALVGLVGLCLTASSEDCLGWQTLLRLLPGAVCLGLGWLTKEGIGYGDGLMLLCLGCFLSLPQLLSVCFAALTLAGAAAIFLLLALRRSRKTRIPFVPFLLAGYGILLLAERGWCG